MKKRLALLALAVVVVGGAAVAFETVHAWSRSICWMGHPPDRIAGYQQGATVTATIDDLARLDSWHTDPPLVLQQPVLGICPRMDPSGPTPMVIWLQIGDNQFVSYERGGGP